MDIFLIICGSLLMILGIAECLLPILPGPPLSYLGQIAIHFDLDHLSDSLPERSLKCWYL